MEHNGTIILTVCEVLLEIEDAAAHHDLFWLMIDFSMQNVDYSLDISQYLLSVGLSGTCQYVYTLCCMSWSQSNHQKLSKNSAKTPGNFCIDEILLLYSTFYTHHPSRNHWLQKLALC